MTVLLTPTSEPVTLEAGRQYGFVWLVKENAGADYAQVAWRIEGDPTPAADLPAISGAFITPADAPAVSDPGGASVTITQDLRDVTQAEGSSLTLTVGRDHRFALGLSNSLPVVQRGHAAHKRQQLDPAV